MKLEEDGIKLTKIATALHQSSESECAGAILIKGDKMVVALVGSDEMTEDRRAEITLKLGQYLTKMGQGMKDGTVEKEELNLEEDEGRWTSN